MNAFLDTSKLRERHKQAVGKMLAMNKVVEDSGEPFTDEQQKEYEGLQNSATALQKQIKTFDDANEHAAALLNDDPGDENDGDDDDDKGGGGKGFQNTGHGRTGIKVNQNQGKVPKGKGTIVVKPPEFTKDPKCGFQDAGEFFEFAQMYGESAMGRRQGFQDERIDYLATKNVAKRTGASFLNDCSDGSCDPGGSTIDLTGSVFVPKEFDPTIYKTEAAFPQGAFNTTRRSSRAMHVTRKYRLDKDHRESVTGGFAVGRQFEHCCNVSSAAKYTEFTVIAHALYGAYCASDMLIEQNPQLIIQEVEDGFKTEFDVQRMVELLNGTGVGEYLGVWRSGALIKVAPEGGVGSADVTKLDIYKMGARAWRGPNRSSLVWIAGLGYETILKTLQDTVVSTANHFMYDPNGGPDWADGTLDGIPIVFTELVPGPGFLGGLGLYNWSEYVEYTWRPMRNASSIHARFVCNEQLWKFWQYTGGAPTWQTTMIPKCVPENANVDDYTLSPFVLLDGNPNDCPKPSRVHGKKPAAASSSS